MFCGRVHVVKEIPHKMLLDREAAAKAIAQGYSPQLDMLTDMVAYASNLIPRAYNSGEKKLRDVIVCLGFRPEVHGRLARGIHADPES